MKVKFYYINYSIYITQKVLIKIYVFNDYKESNKSTKNKLRKTEKYKNFLF